MHSVIETSVFRRRADELPEADRAALIDALASDPMAGDVVPELGGIRKMRWAPAGRGKRGAYRVIYYVLNEDHPVVAILLYAKNEQENVSPAQKKALLSLVAELKKAWT